MFNFLLYRGTVQYQYSRNNTVGVYHTFSACCLLVKETNAKPFEILKGKGNRIRRHVISVYIETFENKPMLQTICKTPRIPIFGSHEIFY